MRVGGAALIKEGKAVNIKHTEPVEITKHPGIIIELSGEQCMKILERLNKWRATLEKNFQAEFISKPDRQTGRIP